MNAPVPVIDIAGRVKQYVQLRDMIKEKKKAHKEELKPLEDCLDKLNSVLLGYLNNTNQECASTVNGSVYKNNIVSVSIADADAFMNHVKAHNAWELLDRKANKAAVEAFVEANKTPPPGVNYSVTHEVGVRRPTK